MHAISNTTVISNFCGVGQIELLHRCFKNLYLSMQVVEEIQSGLLQGYEFYEDIETHIFPFSDSGWLRLISLNTQDEFLTFRNLLSNLHIGEASCLSIAYHHEMIFHFLVLLPL